MPSCARRFGIAFATLLLATCAGLLGCKSANSSDGGSAADAGECGASPSLDCQVAFDPSYDAIFQNVLLPTCGSPSTGGSCHGPNGKQGGLVLSDHDMAYDYLLGNVKGAMQVVVPEKPSCSLLERRIESSNPTFRMPLGEDPLSANVRCAIRKWIAAGAMK